MSILALAGGVGGAKLAEGLAAVLPPGDLTVAVNVGDDFEHLGLHISPDIDTVTYTLAGLNNKEQGWGLEGETWNFITALERLGGDSWFRLGDRDIATHIERTRRLKAETLFTGYNGLGQAATLKAGLIPYVAGTTYTDFGETQKVSLTSTNTSVDHTKTGFTGISS